MTLGAGTLLAAVVGGQVVAALVLDHFGWVGFPEHPISGLRLLGAGLVMLGVALIQRWCIFHFGVAAALRSIGSANTKLGVAKRVAGNV